jgi:Icc-related predicted phosphoesterase
MRGAELAEKWRIIPHDTDVLITHCPPFGILDEVPRQYWLENTGCEELRKRVEALRPKLHIFGHIHCSYGEEEQFSTHFVNASNCDESYNPTNAPVIIDL